METKKEEKKISYKPLFFLSYKEESWKRESFISALKSKYMIIHQGQTILVDTEDYEKALVFCRKIAKSFELLKSFWKNFYGEDRPLGYVPLSLAEMAEGRSFYKKIELNEFVKKPYKGMPYDVKTYLIKLNECLNTEIVLTVRNSRIILLIDEKLDIEEIKEKIEQFNQNYAAEGIMPFEKVKNVSLVEETEDEYNKKGRSLTSGGALSFFEKSAFYSCINSPAGHYFSIVESDDPAVEEEKTHVDGYHFLTPLFTKEITIPNNDENIRGAGAFIVGNYVVTLSLDDWQYFEKSTEIFLYDNDVDAFKLEDRANFFVKTVRDGQKVTVRVKAKIERSTEGCAFGHITPYTAFVEKALVPLAPERAYDSDITIMVNDTYEIVFNKYLLHTTSISPCYEIYGLPEDFKIEDGIKNLPILAVFEEIEDLGLSSEDLVKRYLLAPKTE